MKNKHITSFTLAIMIFFGNLAHGTVFIDTGFEGSTSLPAGWTQSNVSGTATWTIRQGGGSGTPSTARSGTNNATLYVGNTSENKTRLTSPAFNTIGFTNPTLTFWHTQALWSPDQDELKVFFSSDGGTNWTQLAYYTTSVPAWTQRTLVIPSVSANSRIMFEGNARYGHGVCLDDIQVTGVPDTISEVSVSATDPSASEVAQETGRWTITRIGNTTGAISVNFSLSGNATQGSDYTISPSSPISFAAGETSKVVTLTPIDDAVGSEGNEVATLTLTAGTGYVIGVASDNISIYDDEGYDLNVLVIGSTRDSSEQFGGTSKPFSPTAIGTQLRSILAGSGLGSVNVVVTDCYAAGTTVMGSNTNAYNLASWFHWPFPKGAESARWANLRGEAGTVWDYVVLTDDPYTIEYTPGVYAYGAAKIAEEVAKGSAETILLMPWPASGSSRNIAHYKDVVYRAGRSGGIKVAPGGLAWQEIKVGALTNPNPNADGAFIAAASIYSTIYNQSAAVSDYVYNDAWANTVNTTEADNRDAQQYTGAFTFQNPYLHRTDYKRKIYFSSRGTSTEDYFRKAANSAIGRCRVNVASHCPWNRTTTDWTNNGGDEPWTKWPADFIPPIAWNDGRDGATAEAIKSYQVNPTYWDFAYGYRYQSNTWSQPVEDANDHFVSMMFANDNELANRMMSQGNSARNLPVRTLWAQIHKEFPSENPLMDGSGPHLSQLEHEAVGTYMYTLYSGRCPLDPEPTTLDKTWVARKIGYETAWKLGRCQMRAPGFKVMPSATATTTVTPTTTETMTVQFILPPKQNVTVNVSSSDSGAAIVSRRTLVFTPSNYNIPQQISVAGIPGATASPTFNVVFTTSSADEVYNGLSDSWAYTNNRSATAGLTQVNNGTTAISTNQNTPVSINLNAAGSNASNTILLGPVNGTVIWTGDGVIQYTPNAGYLGPDEIVYASTVGVTQKIGVIAITVNAIDGQVNIVASDASASEAGPNTGSYLISRNGSTTSPLNVLFTRSGTATNVSDYSLSSTSPVTIPAGQSSVTITLTPVDDVVFSEGNETAILTITANAAYTIGTASATVTISDNDNNPPVVNAGTDQLIYLSGSAPWSPTALTPQLWLDGSAATINAGIVSVVNAGSGGGTVSGPAVLAAGGIGALQAVQFNGSSQYLAGTYANNGTTLTAFFVGKSSSTTQIAYAGMMDVWAVGQASDWNNVGSAVLFGQNNTTANSIYAYRTSAGLSSATGTLTNPFLAATVFDGATNTLHLNGTASSSVASTGNFNAGNVTVGARRTGSAINTWWNGNFGEAIICNTNLNTTDRQKVEGYLAHKWGLTNNLPAVHPYRNNAPGGAVATANLDGTVTDADGQIPTVLWTKISGPGVVSFASATSVDTTATFSQTGTYVLRLTADDGIDQRFDEVTITVNPRQDFINWINGFTGLGGNTASTDDPDGDGNSNGVENYLGTNPGVFSQGLTATGASGNTFTFSHPLNSTVAEDITAVYRWSANLINYQAHGATSGGSTVTFSQSSPVNGIVTVTATVTGTALDKLFVQILVTKQ